MRKIQIIGPVNILRVPTEPLKLKFPLQGANKGQKRNLKRANMGQILGKKGQIENHSLVKMAILIP